MSTTAAETLWVLSAVLGRRGKLDLEYSGREVIRGFCQKGVLPDIYNTYRLLIIVHRKYDLSSGTEYGFELRSTQA